MLFLFKPYFIFIASWFFSVLFLLFAVTEVSFDNYILVVFVFLFSLSFFYVGASSSRYLKSNKIDLNGLNGLNGGERCESYIFILLSFVFLIVCYNYYVFGPPPFLSHFGFKTLEYTVYGRFKGLLIPLLSAIAIINFYTKSIYLKLFFWGVVYFIFLLYVLRGPIIISLFQVTFFYFFTKYKYKKHDRNEYFRLLLKVSIVLFCFVLFFIVLGQNRSGFAHFYQHLKITDAAKDLYPISFLWISTYLSTPLSNFMWYFDTYSFFPEYDFSFLSRILPAFWASESSVIQNNLDSISDYTVDNVSFYLFYWFSSLGLLGVALVNVFYGLFSHILLRFNIFYPLIASCLMFLFFIDYVFYFSTIVEFFILLIYVQVYSKFFGRIK
jgi:hypothetical protein